MLIELIAEPLVARITDKVRAGRAAIAKQMQSGQLNNRVSCSTIIKKPIA